VETIVKVVAITQARMTSTRLPGKVMRQVLGKPLLHYHLERVRRAKRLDGLVVATTTNDVDEPIVALAGRLGLPVFRGSEHDVLARYFGAAQRYSADVVVRVTSDNPLIDPRIIDQTVGRYIELSPNVDYCSNRLPPSYPRGMDVEVLSFRSLAEAHREAVEPDDREHVTLFVWRQDKRYRVANVPYHSDQSRHRWTVDTPEDFELIRRILEAVVPSKADFTLEDCLDVIADHPEWPELNRHVEQKWPRLIHQVDQRSTPSLQPRG
jgi:spore coat polysaccharide biosynthesis protein SpsF